MEVGSSSGPPRASLSGGGGDRQATRKKAGFSVAQRKMSDAKGRMGDAFLCGERGSMVGSVLVRIT